MDKPMETRGFFTNRRGRRLYYASHGDHGAPEAWVFCNPFLEEKVFSHPVYVAFARQLAAQGGFALRFDYEGDGDSEGEVDGLGVADWIADIEAAAGLAGGRFHARAVSLFGLRLGASLAWLAAARVAARRLLLWEPVVKGANYFQECLRINLTTQLSAYKRVVENRDQIMRRVAEGGTVNIAGYEVGEPMATGISEIDLVSQPSGVDGAVQVLHFQKTAGSPIHRDMALVGTRPGVRLDAFFVPPFWQESKHYDPEPTAPIAASVRFVRDAMLATGSAR